MGRSGVSSRRVCTGGVAINSKTVSADAFSDLMPGKGKNAWRASVELSNKFLFIDFILVKTLI